MEKQLVANLLACASAYAAARAMALSTLGRIATGESGFFDRLGDPASTFTVRKYDAVMAFFAANWPDGTPWPRGVPRPKAAEPA